MRLREEIYKSKKVKVGDITIGCVHRMRWGRAKFAATNYFGEWLDRFGNPKAAICACIKDFKYQYIRIMKEEKRMRGAYENIDKAKLDEVNDA